MGGSATALTVLASVSGVCLGFAVGLTTQSMQVASECMTLPRSSVA